MSDYSHQEYLSIIKDKEDQFDSWHIREVPRIVKIVEKAVASSRYDVFVHGGVVRNGRVCDLDLCLAPKCIQDRGLGDYLLEKIAAKLNAKRINQYGQSVVSGRGSQTMRLPDDRLINFTVLLEGIS